MFTIIFSILSALFHTFAGVIVAPVPFITSHSNDERRAPVQTPRMSGFDKSFKNLLSAKVGTLVPVLCDPVIAGSRVNLRDALVAKMPPLASDTFMNCDLKLEAFYVPASSLYGGFNDWITKRDVFVNGNVRTGSAGPATYSKAKLPRLNPVLLLNDDPSGTSYSYAGSLADYLGFKGFPVKTLANMPDMNPFPFIAYQRIYDRFYRNSLVQRPLFSRCSNAPQMGEGSPQTYQFVADNLPYITFTEADGANAGFISGASMDATGRGGQVNFTFSDGSTIMDLRQRNFDADYFTTATPTAQKGDPSAVEFKVDLGDGAGSISIAAIRAANALQIWAERNNMIDDNIHAYNVAHYGVKSTGAGESCPRFLGQHIVNVYSKGVTQNSGASDVATNNPFNSVGAEYGRMEANGQGSLIEGFEAPEYGYIMVLASFVPRVAYSSGVRRHLIELVGPGGVSDIPDAILQGVGPQEVYQFELDAAQLERASVDASLPIFGYQQRYAHYMDKLDEVHGLFRDGESLAAFAAQRLVTGGAQISSEFLQIPTDYLDQVAAVEDSISQFGYWLDIYFDYKVSMPIAAYSIPTLENPAGDVEWIKKPGYSL